MPKITIKPGDNLTNLARQHNTTIKELLSLNPEISNPNLIRAGRTLNLPYKEDTPKRSDRAIRSIEQQNKSSKGIESAVQRRIAKKSDKQERFVSSLTGKRTLAPGQKPRDNPVEIIGKRFSKGYRDINKEFKEKNPLHHKRLFKSTGKPSGNVFARRLQKQKEEREKKEKEKRKK